MTATHDKEWIVDGTIPKDELSNEKTYAYTTAKHDYHIMIPQSLLDQIRRDAVDEYKDNIYQLCRLLNITKKEKQILDKFLPVILRAKMLGKNVK